VLKSGEIAPKILAPTYGNKDRWISLDDGRKNLNNEEKRVRQLGFTPPKK
jgi:hypothetical protein